MRLSAALIGAACLAFAGAAGVSGHAGAQTEPEPAQTAPVASPEATTLPPVLRSTVSADGPMDIGIAKEELPVPGEDGAPADGEGETETPTDEEPSVHDISSEGADEAAEPAADGATGTEDPAGASEDEVGNGPALPGLLEAREELRPSGAVAVLRGLDKITARITVVEAPVGQPVQFGRLEVLASYCFKRPPEEPPEVTAFIQVKDMRSDDPDKAQIFSGWMFASSPALHALEHPVYDVWLIDCKAESPESSFGGLPKDPTPKELDSKRP